MITSIWWYADYESEKTHNKIVRELYDIKCNYFDPASSHAPQVAKARRERISAHDGSNAGLRIPTAT
ncbi:hypothetical protein X777_13701 [Ooceraea biroi]|uniref:Uncharacterized protein n=1 Tax=Ooceraea biroi TaxID=2015173 RepID=A0A026VZT6_OOCBI|nr:hypothetical protein X777_13701 [Ooceraea biroi]